ncbi:MAG: adenylate/guanylate cyclase [Parcubacteria group bacterium Licking1014_17]|nr:MAG: adenylate/guanylate cyclase [Parcubacteria group bacterium Licking1014_17]
MEKLIRERMEPSADKKKIDQRIWDLFGEEWCVMFTDLSGFSRNVAKFGIIHFLQTIFESHRLLIPIIENYDGVLLKTEGDSFLVIFRNPKKAVESAIAMQKAIKEYDAKKTDEEKVLLCIGIGHGRMLRIGDEDVFGAEVNAASKLGEDTAKAWEILITDSMKSKIKDMKGVSFKEIKEIPPGAKKAYKIIYKL